MKPVLIAERVVEQTLRKDFPNMVSVPICAFGMITRYYADDTYSNEIGLTMYVEPSKKVEKDILNKLPYISSTDKVVLFRGSINICF